MKYLTYMEPSIAYFIVPILSHLVALCFQFSIDHVPYVCLQIFKSQFLACLLYQQGLSTSLGCCFAHF